VQIHSTSLKNDINRIPNTHINNKEDKMTGDQLKALEGRLLKAADQLRANSKLTATEYSFPVLGNNTYYLKGWQNPSERHPTHKKQRALSYKLPFLRIQL